MSEEQQTFYFLGVALILGLLIGVERCWKARELVEGHRVAGVRITGLLGLLGGATVLLASTRRPDDGLAADLVIKAPVRVIMVQLHGFANRRHV